ALEVDLERENAAFGSGVKAGSPVVNGDLAAPGRGMAAPVEDGTGIAPIASGSLRSARGKSTRTGTGRSPSHIVVTTRPWSDVSTASWATPTVIPARASAGRSRTTRSCGTVASR